MGLELKKNEVLVLKKVFKDENGELWAYNKTFKYPKKGKIKAPDWKDTLEIGHGLHGQLWNSGNFNIDSYGNTFLLLKVDKSKGFVDLGDKVKFKEAIVLKESEEVSELVDIIKRYAPKDTIINYDFSTSMTANQGYGSTANQGYGSTANQGYMSTANQGHMSTANQGSGSTANQGHMSTANQGYMSTANQGHMSTANQGYGSTATIYGSTCIYRNLSKLGCVIMFSDDKMSIIKAKKDTTLYIEDMKVKHTYTTTPNKIIELLPHEVFVFGSNLNGHHAGGAAKLAKDKFNAIEGQGEGLQGQSYAFPTLDKDRNQIPLSEWSKHIDNLIKCANNHTRKIFFVTKIGCVDKDTEFLTPSGWKKISEYIEGDLVMQYNENGTAEFVKPLRYIKQPQKEFIHFKTKYGVDQVLSYNHQMLFRNRFTDEMYKLPAEEVMRMHNKLKNGFGDKIKLSFTPKLNTSLPISEETLRCFVMASADGYWDKNSNNIYLKFRKIRKISRCEILLRNAGIEYKRSNNKYEVSFSIDKSSFPLSKGLDKLWKASYEQLKIIADEVLNWDGTFSNNKPRFSTRKKEEADFVQYVFSSIGKRATLRNYERKNGVDYDVLVSDRNECSLEGSPETRKDVCKIIESKDGFEYCFTVPSHNLILRRNKNIFITGNCGIAGFNEEEVKEVFFGRTDISANIILPEGWRKI